MTTCPECNSTDIEEENDMITNMILLGISMVMNTNYTCNNCGNNWSR